MILPYVTLIFIKRFARIFHRIAKITRMRIG